jgi:hypothetical protein
VQKRNYQSLTKSSKQENVFSFEQYLPTPI